MFGITLYKHEKLSQEVIESLAVFKKYMTYKRYSENTIKSYTEVLVEFFNFFHDKKLQEINNEDVVYFNTECIVSGRKHNKFKINSIELILPFFL
jgi:site-specific recombinase XerD